MSDVTFDQITREKKPAGCIGCRAVVTHVQVAGRTRSGHKVYEWVPMKHRRRDGPGQCLYREEIRSAVKL